MLRSVNAEWLEQSKTALREAIAANAADQRMLRCRIDVLVRELVLRHEHVDNDRPPMVRAGEPVRQGQVIACVGSSSRSAGYHMEWRVELRGAFVNPRQFL